MKNTENNGLSLLSLEYSQYRIIDEFIYIMAGSYNGVFRASTSDGQVEFLKKFIQRKNYEICPFYLAKNDDCLFFLPARADEIAIYDPKRDKLTEILLGWKTAGKVLTREYTFANGRLWLFPQEDDRIIEVDYKRERVVSTFNLKKDYVQKIGEDYHFFSAYGCYCHKGKVFLACYETPYLAVFDMEIRETTFIQIPEISKGFTSLIGKEDMLYIINLDGRLVIWNIGMKKVEKIINIGKNVPKFEPKYCLCMNIVGENLFVCDIRDITKMIKISLTKDDIVSEWSNNLLSELKENNTTYNLLFGYYEGDLLYGCDNKERYFCIDLFTEKLKWIKRITYDSCLLKECIRDEHTLVNKNQSILPENAITFENLVLKGVQDAVLVESESGVGEKIHQYMMQNL